MKLVVDTSVIFSLFSKDPFIRNFILEKELSLYSVKELKEELAKEAGKICRITKRSFGEFESVLDMLSDIIEFLPVKQEYIEEAESLISHKNDVPFLALALELEIPIWSNDWHFKEQFHIPVFTVEELKKYFSDNPDDE